MVRADTSDAQGSTITNTASVSSATTDANGANNTSAATTSVITSADLAVTKTASNSVVAGTTLTYTIHVTNSGPSNASGVILTDILPAGVTFVSPSPCSFRSGVRGSCGRLDERLEASAQPSITRAQQHGLAGRISSRPRDRAEAERCDPRARQR